MTTTAIALASNPEQQVVKRERIYVGVYVGYRQHVAAASPLSVSMPNATRMDGAR